MLSQSARQRPRHTGIPTLNKASRFADRLYAWFPLNGQPFMGSLQLNTQLTSFLLDETQYNRWGPTSIGMAFDGYQGGALTNITVNAAPVGLNSLTAFTLAVRIYMRDAIGGPNNFGRIAIVEDTNMGLSASNTNTDLIFVDPSGGDTATGCITTNAWYDIVGVYDSGVQKALWSNGNKFTLTTRSGATGTHPGAAMCIGSRPLGSNDRLFNGFIVDVGWWTYAWPDTLCYAWADPRTKYDLYWQPNNIAYAFMGIAASGAITRVSNILHY